MRRRRGAAARGPSSGRSGRPSWLPSSAWCSGSSSSRSSRSRSSCVPKPSAVAIAFVENFSEIMDGLRKTGYVAVTGLVAGVVIAVVMALLSHQVPAARDRRSPRSPRPSRRPRSSPWRRCSSTWFGQVEPTAKQAVVAVVVLFPVFVSTSKGLLQVQPVHLELMRTYAAGGWRVLREVRVPECAAVLLHRRSRIAASLSVIAAIVAEYFGGEQGDSRRHHHPERRAVPLRPGLGRRHRRRPARHGPVRARAAARAPRPSQHRPSRDRPLTAYRRHRTASLGGPHETHHPDIPSGHRRRRRHRSSALAACGTGGTSDGGGAAGGGTAATNTACASTTKVKLQLQWVAQSQFAGYYAAKDTGLLGQGVPRRDHRRGRRRHRAADPAGHRRGRLRYRVGAQGAGVARAGREDHRHRPDLPAVRHAAGLVEGLGADLGREPGRQEGRQLGLRQRVRAVRRHSRRRASTRSPVSPSSSSSSTWPRC